MGNGAVQQSCGGELLTLCDQLEAADFAEEEDELLDDSPEDDAAGGVFLALSMLVDEDEDSEEDDDSEVPEAGEEVFEASRESLR